MMYHSPRYNSKDIAAHFGIGKSVLAAVARELGLKTRRELRIHYKPSAISVIHNEPPTIWKTHGCTTCELENYCRKEKPVILPCERYCLLEERPGLPDGWNDLPEETKFEATLVVDGK